MIDGQLWREECFQVISQDADKTEGNIAEIANNLSDLNDKQLDELEKDIESFINCKAYIETFIAVHNLDEDEVWKKVQEDYEEAMSRQHS